MFFLPSGFFGLVNFILTFCIFGKIASERFAKFCICHLNFDRCQSGFWNTEHLFHVCSKWHCSHVQAAAEFVEIRFFLLSLGLILENFHLSLLSVWLGLSLGVVIIGLLEGLGYIEIGKLRILKFYTLKFARHTMWKIYHGRNVHFDFWTFG